MRRVHQMFFLIQEIFSQIYLNLTIFLKVDEDFKEWILEEIFNNVPILRQILLFMVPQIILNL